MKNVRIWKTGRLEEHSPAVSERAGVMKFCAIPEERIINRYIFKKYSGTVKCIGIIKPVMCFRSLDTGQKITFS